MGQDLIPLFLHKKKGEQSYEPVGINIKIDNQNYKSASFIEGITNEIEENLKEIVNYEEMGKLTLAAYILIESLHKAGMQTLATSLWSDSQALLHSAICCAIGMEAGMKIEVEFPEGVQFETVPGSNPLSVRNITDGDSEDSD